MKKIVVLVVLVLIVGVLYYNTYLDRSLDSRVGVSKEDVIALELNKSIEGVDMKAEVTEEKKAELLNIIYNAKYKKNFTNAGFSQKSYYYDFVLGEKDSKDKFMFSFDLEGNSIFRDKAYKYYYLKMNEEAVMQVKALLN